MLLFIAKVRKKIHLTNNYGVKNYVYENIWGRREILLHYRESPRLIRANAFGGCEKRRIFASEKETNMSNPGFRRDL